MSFYVFALVDQAPPARFGRGLSAPVSFRRVPAGFAAVERRADVPPVELGSLRAHARVVDRLATMVPAILPVRFGTLVGASELEELLEERDEEIGDAFDQVRGRVQFTWRTASRSGRPVAGRRPARMTAASGAEYMRRLSRAAHPAVPPAFARPRRLGPFTVAERYTPAGPLVPPALYHLVDRDRVDAYAAAAATIRKAAPGLTWSGPFPPYAFAAEVL